MSKVAQFAIPQELVVESKILQDLCKKRPHKVFIVSLFNLSTYFFLSLVGFWTNDWWLWAVIWCFQGMIISGFLGAIHEGVHGCFGSSDRTNHLAGVFWSTPVFINFTLYKYFHLKHHKYTNVPGDPEQPEEIKVFSNIWDYVLSFVRTSTFYILCWKMSVEACFGSFPDFIRSEKARRAVQIDNIALLLWLLLSATITYWWMEYALLFYWCPLIVSYPMSFLTILPEHYGCTQSSDPQCNTRTTSSNFFVRWVIWYGNYHAEHHLYPSVPCYNLPHLHSLIGKHFTFQQRSFTLFHLKLIWTLLKN
ncbi:fatty acid desaturase family protein [Scytonema sp. NUACC21]